jgi:hypothetical protein
MNPREMEALEVELDLWPNNEKCVTVTSHEDKRANE